MNDCESGGLYLQCHLLFNPLLTSTLFSVRRMPVVARNMSAAPKAKGVAYREKTFVENWCMDVGVSSMRIYLS